MPSARSYTGVLGLITAFLALIAQPAYQRLVTLGALRPKLLLNIHGLQELKLLPDTVHCEDLHYHESSKLLYSACQDSLSQRFDWFPALGRFANPKNLNTGSLTVIDPKTLNVRKLKLNGFHGPFITHGIDIFEADSSTLYIFAINHLPNDDYYQGRTQAVGSANKAASRVEVFKHAIGSTEASWLRSVSHPLIRTPNDLLATGRNSFYVSNDHHYREAPLRDVEDVLNHQTAPWSDVMHVQFDVSSSDPAAGVKIQTALTKRHTPNGLGHVSKTRPHELILNDATSGVFARVQRQLGQGLDPALTVIEEIQLDSTIDNPSWYEDQYATPANNASGYVMAGLGKAVDVGQAFDPMQPLATMVWHIRADAKNAEQSHKGWEKRLVFQDDGHAVRGGATGVIVGIDPKANGGKKQGLLFVTGFMTKAVAVARIDL